MEEVSLPPASGLQTQGRAGKSCGGIVAIGHCIAIVAEWRVCAVCTYVLCSGILVPYIYRAGRACKLQAASFLVSTTDWRWCIDATDASLVQSDPGSMNR